MIKLIVFDLDGVLLSSKSTHYDALNKALIDFNLTPISYDEHISKYDGLPTKKKLQLLKIDSGLHETINKRKQEYTIEFLENSIEINDELIHLFIKLKQENYTLAVASNSIRSTVLICLYKLKILKYFDIIFSNEDVKNGKPNPEMYLKCMLIAGVGPRETLILEDSYVGREGVFNSGAYLCPVNDVKDVNYDLIKRYINKSNNVKNKWKDNNMNILIPMAGAGSRFQQSGYTFPKPLIDIHGKPMIQFVVENINIDGRYIFVVRKEHYEKYDLKHMLEVIAPGCEIICVDKMTEGAACTTLLAEQYINNNEQLLIVNSDQWIKWDSSDFMYAMQKDYIDGGILTFKNTHPKWSYVKVDGNDFITEAKEKQVISDNATVGIYYWKRGSDYVRYANQMINKNIRVKNEFYVCPVYEECLLDNKKIKNYSIEKMYGLGVPEDLQYFINNYNEIINENI